ncbi:hypothetical protein WBG78_02280 [Chryseolinea sp. T2]|uniref:hypothetical protein n=1 Tax=Chryseolinea sp. T2 TaxID=3129255 RepID=UPI00307787A1
MSNSLRDKVLRSNFFIKLRSWEYWPFGIVQFPVFIYFAWLSLRARSLVFFSASNPGITMGGMFGESKYDVLQKVPAQYIPVTILVNLPASVETILNDMADRHLKFPVIVKPDIGERGFMVKKIESEDDMIKYLGHQQFNFLIQEYVDLPLEFGIFYTRFPNSKKGHVTSVVMKEMLAITGDGSSTLRQLILNLDRAKLQWDSLSTAFRESLDLVVPQGQRIELVSIGNHCLGTKFLDGTHLMNSKLDHAFDVISQQIPEFYFGRFDLRCASIADLYTGQIKIMELNGCGAEPAHIYHPGYSLRKAFGVLFRHWHNIFVIAQQNERRGVSYTTLREAVAHYKRFKEATAS